MDRASGIRALIPLVPAVALLVALLAILPSDPAAGVTSSRSPFTDEGYYLLNSRNLVLLGGWSTGDWNLHLVDGPFAPAMAGVFSLFGVSVETARVLSVALSVTMVALVALVVSGEFGVGAGTLAAFALAGQTLFLYYGRLAMLEPMVTFFLMSGALLLVAPIARSTWRTGVPAGLLLGLAIAAKPSAGFAALGAVIGALVASGFAGRAWRTALASLGGIGLVGAGWLATVGLPNWNAVLVDLRIWAREPLPASLGEAGDRISEYLTVSDGAIPMTIGLALAALLGLAVAVSLWRRLDAPQRRLVGVAAGWFVAGMAVLLVVPYRPNRYLVPLLPPLAMLAGIVGWTLVGRTGPWRPMRWLGAAVLAVVVVLPGALAYAGWVSNASYELDPAQRLVEDNVRAGDSVAGELAPTLALRAPVIVYIPRPADRVDAQLPPGEPDWHIVPVEDATPDRPGCVAWGNDVACLVRN